MNKPSTKRLDAQVQNLKDRGVALPRNAARARLAAHQMHRMATTPGDLQATVVGATSDIRAIEQNTKLIRAMGAQRRASWGDANSLRLGQRVASSSASSDVYAAIPRFYDPMEYWDLSGLPWNMADEGHRHKLHKWMRLFYATHYLVPILIDIFTRFPLVGMELTCKDKKVQEFYEDLFFNSLDYGEFLVQLGREFWCVGEAFPLGSFDEDLGVWEREELINPEDVVIENFPLLGSQQLKIVPPEYLKQLAQTKQPAKEYKQLEINFPEILPYLRKNEKIPVSGVLLKQVANKLSSWDDHGTPILLRGLRTLIHEEKLLASQDAIAERLYSPLILAKLGADDLGDGQGPWIPGPEELEAFRDDMDLALSSDFRLLVHHFGLDVQNVFGREQMPRLGDDFDRIERRIMQIFGVNPSLLSAGSSSQPYASSALQAEFLNQILRTFQDYLKQHFRTRAEVVAEAQEHYEYEVRGERRIPIMEEVVEYDDDGNKSIVEKNKLLVPELDFATLDLRDEATERQFLQTLRATGVPIPDQKLMVGISSEIEDMVEEYNDELIKKTIAQQEAKMKTYKALQAAGLPIPPDLKGEVESVLQAGVAPGAGGLPGPPPGGGPGPSMGPGQSLVMPPPPPGLGTGPGAGPPGGLGPGGRMGPGGMGGPVPGGGPPPMGPVAPGLPGAVPPISNERRPGMPRPSAVVSHEIEENSPLDNSNSNSTVGALHERDDSFADQEKNPKIVNRLPKAAHNKKRYSFVDEPLHDPEEYEQIEEIKESENSQKRSG